MASPFKSFLEKWLNKEKPISEFPTCDFSQLKYHLRPGDIILVEGRTRVSEVIKMITQSRWSHAALYIGRMHDIENSEIRALIEQSCEFNASEPLIIEGLLGKGTVINKLSDYQRDNLRVCRADSLSHADAARVIAYATERVGTEYDIRQLIDLARLLLPWGIIPRRWRSSLFKRNAGESTRTVCSSMLAEAFSEIDYPILPAFRRTKNDAIELVKRNTKLFTPADFDYSPYFTTMKFPFWGVNEKATYRELPWNQEGLISNDEDK